MNDAANESAIFSMSSEQRDLAIVGLAQADVPARDIAAAVEAPLLLVCEVLNSAKIAPVLPPRTFRIEDIWWDPDCEVIERLPESGTITIGDWERLDQEGVECDALSKFSDLHGYCICGSRVTEVPGAAWPTTSQEAEELLKAFDWTGELRMGDGTYAFVHGWMMRSRYPAHFAYAKSALGPGFDEEAESDYFWLIDVTKAGDFQFQTSGFDNVVFYTQCAFVMGNEELGRMFVRVLSAMGLPSAEELLPKVWRTFELTMIQWVGEPCEALPSVQRVTLECSESDDGVGLPLKAMLEVGKMHGRPVERAIVQEVTAA
ncbi:hypothetical protein MP631_18500 [Xanthomonas phaseoli pv. phaseoli]|nr:hypothetical protein MP631_18500 [Xanthomonas phaseoli pv. phaseoli]